MSDQIGKIDQEKFAALIRKRVAFATVMTLVMLGIYYGFILVLAFDKELWSTKVGEHMTLGIPVGLIVILSAWIMTGIYVSWANKTYDDSVRDIIHGMRGR
jgi:uncharacterized membrane protein (DUF485 family)